MNESDEVRAFAVRLNELCDDMGVPPKGQARQTLVGKLFGVTQKGARRWLEGEGLPETKKCIQIATWGSVNFEWLMTGRGPKAMKEAKFWLVEALEDMGQSGQEAINFLKYSIERSQPLIASEKAARYVRMLDSMTADMAKKKSKEDDSVS